MKKCFSVRDHSLDINLVLFLMRIITGYAFILHGWGKIQNPMNWMGPDSPVPGILQLLAAVAEFGGGIALILGLLTRLASAGLFVTMIVAMIFHAIILGDPFVSKGGGSYELSTIYILISLLFMVMGPGRISIDQKIFGPKA